MLRYGVSLLRTPFPATFPYWTLAVNVIGSFSIGLLAGWLDPEERRAVLLLMAGLCGGFTTFSAFSLETIVLFEAGETSLAFLTVAMNLLGSLLGCGLGYWLAR